MPRKPAFTLVELMITVSIVAILTGVSLVVIRPSAIREKARDSRRSNAILSIQTALELYHAQNSSYPVATNWAAITPTPGVYTDLKPNFIRNLELDPLQDSSPVLTPCLLLNDYRFNYKSDGTYYLLTAQMERDTSASGSLCSNLSQWATKSSCTGQNLYCYGVENRSL